MVPIASWDFPLILMKNVWIITNIDLLNVLKGVIKIKIDYIYLNINTVTKIYKIKIMLIAGAWNYYGLFIHHWMYLMRKHIHTEARMLSDIIIMGQIQIRWRSCWCWLLLFRITNVRLLWDNLDSLCKYSPTVSSHS